LETLAPLGTINPPLLGRLLNLLPLFLRDVRLSALPTLAIDDAISCGLRLPRRKDILDLPGSSRRCGDEESSCGLRLPRRVDKRREREVVGTDRGSMMMVRVGVVGVVGGSGVC
jgi:hypothetical protein